MRTLGNTLFETGLFSLGALAGAYILAILSGIDAPEYCALAVGLVSFCLIGTLFRGIDRVEGMYVQPEPASEPVLSAPRLIPNLAFAVDTPLQRKGLWDYNLPWPEGREILVMYRFSRLLAENPSLSHRRWVDNEKLFRRWEFVRLRTAMIRAGLVVKANRTFQLTKLGLEAIDVQTAPTERA